MSSAGGGIILRRTIIVFILWSLANIATADEMRPAYLELTQQGENIFAVVWKVPLNKNQQCSRFFHLAAVINQSLLRKPSAALGCSAGICIVLTKSSASESLLRA